MSQSAQTRPGKAARRRRPWPQVLRAIGMAIRWLPPLMIFSWLKHRRFSRQFVHEATQHGLPKSVAREMARGMSPAQFSRALRRRPAASAASERA